MTGKTVLRNQPNKDGSYTIRIRVIENRKSRFITTGEKIHKLILYRSMLYRVTR